MTRITRAPLAWRALLAVALGEAALLLATANDYGYHRDELYFREAGEHPAFGYDDQPPLTPLIARAAGALFGETPRGLRMFSVLAICACVVLTGVIARELGGGRRAQVVAAACVAASGLMFAGHLVSTATYDLLFWVVLLALATRLLGRGPTPRLWLAIGLVAGIALENKHLVLLLGASVLAGVLLARRRNLLRPPWPYAAAALALALWLPNLIWQATHGFPQLELAGQISDEDPVGLRIGFVPFQIVLVSFLLAPVWILGVRWLLRGRFRPLGLGYLALLALCVLSAAKPYYAAGYYPLLLAAGTVSIEEWLADRNHLAVVSAGLAASAVLSALVTLPVLPERDFGESIAADLNEDALETIGWPSFADTLARVHRSLPPDKRDRAVIFTANYGEAGAVARYGPERGLPRAYSGHNSYDDFGRPPDGAVPVIVVGFWPAYLADHFRGCHLAARIDNGVGADNEEQHARVDICDAPARPWSELWPHLDHLDA